MADERQKQDKIIFSPADRDTFRNLLYKALSLVNSGILPDDAEVVVRCGWLKDFELEVKPGMTFSELYDIYNAKRWGAMDKLEEHKEVRREIKYYDFIDFANALKQIKPCDLTSETTSLRDALKFCEDVMNVLRRATNLDFILSIEQRTQLSKMLRALGCCKHDEAAQKFIKLPEKSSLDDMCAAENNIQFPLTTFTKIMDDSPDIFRRTLRNNNNAFFETDYTYIYNRKWLETQQKAYSKDAEQA